ncbi:hypothetical protein ABPG72_022350 [Tetrahymena utriculariae]
MKKTLIFLALLAISAFAQSCPPNSSLKFEVYYCNSGYYGASADKCTECPNKNLGKARRKSDCQQIRLQLLHQRILQAIWHNLDDIKSNSSNNTANFNTSQSFSKASSY